ncbi:hypothetical protein K525DRAFT_275728 [Schizophyllum commune Loenen D]|nr:hypothetical protein K525DRAFT_275728 [Schizophyllum commune Loenen D]
MASFTFKNDKDLLSAEPGRATIAMIRAGFCPEGAQALPYRHRKAAITVRMQNLNDILHVLVNGQRGT